MNTTLVLFRRDLRLADNPALSEALKNSGRVVPLFIFDPKEGDAWPPGSASRWWLHHSLMALDSSLREVGSRLIIRCGAYRDVLRQIVDETGAGGVFWNRLYEPALIARDKEIKAALRAQGQVVETFNSALLHEPWTVKRDKGEPYKVFTPFWKASQRLGLEQAPWPAQDALPSVPDRLASLHPDELGLLPKMDWDHGLRESWRPVEKGAIKQMAEFIDNLMASYNEERDRPGHAGTSRLSPHLHFGEIGPRQIVQAIRIHTSIHADAGLLQNAESYIRQIAWREFAHHLLYHFPHTPEHPLDARFEHFPWTDTRSAHLRAWQRGMTGIPLVDAGMRELWHTGWMHNLVRMVVASFLTKNLRLPWLEGARWFWDTLADANLANNTLGWQWVSGCGADAAPYFRIFNPALQGKRFDPYGDYVRRWVPELAQLPATHIHQPWQAPSGLLQAHGVHLGENYPLRIIDLKTSREQALAAFHAIRADGFHHLDGTSDIVPS